MDIAEMHVYFRQYAQQMGMQNVRAILPEQIDILINTSISDIINQLIKDNIGVTNDRIITDNSKIGQINAFRTLYKVKNVSMTGIIDSGRIIDTFKFEAKDRNKGLMRYTVQDHTNDDAQVKANLMPDDYLFLVDFSLSYRQTITGIDADAVRTTLPSYDADSLETNYFPVRLIDDTYLADTLNDFVLKNRLRSPIMVMYNNGTFDIYIDKFIKRTVTDKDYYVLANNLVPYELRVSYIAKPAIVKYSEDINGDNVDCDLPEDKHVDIIKHAVDLYRVAVSGSMQAQQQQDRSQSAEDTRNNYRNEGY